MIQRLSLTDHDLRDRLEQSIRPRAIVADGESSSAIVFTQTVELAVERCDLPFIFAECRSLRIFGGDYLASLELDAEGNVCMVHRGAVTFLKFIVEADW